MRYRAIFKKFFIMLSTISLLFNTFDIVSLADSGPVDILSQCKITEWLGENPQIFISKNTTNKVIRSLPSKRGNILYELGSNPVIRSIGLCHVETTGHDWLTVGMPNGEVGYIYAENFVAHTEHNFSVISDNDATIEICSICGICKNLYDSNLFIPNGEMNDYDKVHLALKIISFVPVLTEAALIVDTVLYMSEGDWSSAAMNCLVILPMLSNLGKAGEIINETKSLINVTEIITYDEDNMQTAYELTDLGNGLHILDEDGSFFIFRKGNSKQLGINMDIAYEETNLQRFFRMDSSANHHIVGSSERAMESRIILSKYNIDVDDAVNGVVLPGCQEIADELNYGNMHKGRHHNEYIDAVNERLRGAVSKEDVIERLNQIAEDLINGVLTLDLT